MSTDTAENNCPCTVKCSRHGKCELCRAHHANKKHPPRCEREQGANVSKDNNTKPSAGGVKTW